MEILNITPGCRFRYYHKLVFALQHISINGMRPITSCWTIYSTPSHGLEIRTSTTYSALNHGLEVRTWTIYSALRHGLEGTGLHSTRSWSRGKALEYGALGHSLEVRKWTTEHWVIV